MGVFQTIKNLFVRSKYVMTTTSLQSITDHPKIAISETEFSRINKNLRYYAGKFDQVTYQNSNGEERKRDFNHLPIGRTAAKKVASLVFNEQAEITVDNEARDFINETLKNDRFNKNFERYLESALALGGLAMRPYVDNDQVKISFVQAPVFLPLQSNTQDVSSAAIVTKSTKTEGKQTKYYTLIELHEWKDEGLYFITNELYKSDNANTVGSRVPLSEVYEDLEDGVQIADLSRPLFTYLKPPGMNNKDINSPLGLSIFDNAITTIDFINRTYDEFMWEVRMGQRRVAVPDSMVRMSIQEQSGDVKFMQRFDSDQNVYQMLGNGEHGIGITDLTTPIRSDDYIKAINEGLSLFEMQIGVSAGMFTFDGKSMKTATEIVSENSDTYQMRNSIVSLVEQSLKELVVSICELASAYKIYKGAIPKLDDVNVNLDDGVFTDKNALLDYWTKAYSAGLVSREIAITKALDVSEKEAEEIISQINQEAVKSTQRSLEDVIAYGE